MYCPKCGEKNPNDARFCGNCGAALPVSQSSAGAEANPARHGAAHAGQAVPEQGGGAARPPTGTSADRPRESATTASTSSDVSSELKIGIAVASVIIPIIGIIMGAIYMKDANESKKSAGKLWLFIGVGMTVFYCLLAIAGGY